MAGMNSENKTHKDMEEAIDAAIIAQAENDDAWEEPIAVRRQNKVSVLPLPEGLVSRAAFLAALRNSSNVNDWLTNIIRERIEFEEATIAEIGQDRKQP